MIVTSTGVNDSYAFDPQLPDLALAFNRQAVMRLFEERWPAPLPANTHVTVTSCRLQDTKYQPATRCVATYELEFQASGASHQRTVGVLEITPAGVAHRLFSSDPVLPWLKTALDAHAMRDHFAATLPNLVPIQNCTVTPIRYKPGARCVFRYDLQTAAGPRTFFGKLLARDGDTLAATISGLHEVSERTATMPRIPQPLAYWPDVQMLVQPAVVGGAELHTRAFAVAEPAAVRELLLREAGRFLAGLHGCAGIPAPPRTFADDMAELREYLPPMQQAAPALTPSYGDGIAQLERMASTRPNPVLVPSHGAFRTDQFMLEGDALVMIDLDGFCWAHPERDIGNFLAYLEWKALRQPEQAAFMRQAGAVFIQGYRALRPTLDHQWIKIYSAASMLKIAGRRFRSLTVKEWPLVPSLVAAAHATMASSAAPELAA